MQLTPIGEIDNFLSLVTDPTYLIKLINVKLINVVTTAIRLFFLSQRLLQEH